MAELYCNRCEKEVSTDEASEEWDEYEEVWYWCCDSCGIYLEPVTLGD